MALRYLLDEHLRGGGLWQAIRQHNASGVDVLDVVRVGDPPDLPLGTGDPDVLTLVDREVGEPGPGEVRVRVHRSGVNPTDSKSRRGSEAGTPV